MGCNGCGEKDVKEIAEAGAEQAKRLTNRLGMKGPVPQEPPALQPVKLMTLAPEKAAKVQEQFDIAAEADQRARDLILMAMPSSAPEGAEIRFDQNTMTYYYLRPAQDEQETE